MNLFATQKYNQTEAFCQDAFRWEISFNKLSYDPFLGNITLIDIGDLQIGEIRLNGKIEQKGLSPAGFRTIVIPADNSQAFNWLKRPVTERDFLLFSKRGELDAVSFNNFHYYMISVQDELLADLYQKFGFINLEKLLNSEKHVLRLKQDYFTYIQNYLQHQFLLLNKNPQLINSTTFRYKLRYKFTYLLLGFLDTRTFNPIKVSHRKRDKALSLCKQYIEVNKNEHIAISQLTEVSNMSERTLQLAFLEKYSVSPKEYIINLKLNDVRIKLVKSKKGKGAISHFAKESGFNHLGQFAAAYKKLFNELPKDTLKR